ncbi:hypothetical protein [Paenibacillus polymyxa]|uniref:hypothetical protein n=1 Tax=Paenibacillus polymyxa TaxID=1406 RepID=UPI002024C469|nr:hypothetical protein [Paenibacillus polymyxa]WDZ55837.1 hypothetical protein MF622_09630 [Paenibacillus polymyxa]
MGVIPAWFAKALSFRGEQSNAILIVAGGNAKIDNKKCRLLAFNRSFKLGDSFATCGVC